MPHDGEEPPTLALPRANSTHRGGDRSRSLPLPVLFRRGEVRWGVVFLPLSALFRRGEVRRGAKSER